MKTNLRIHYIKLRREAKRLSSLSKDPTIPRAKTWDISRQAHDKRQQAIFYEKYLECIKEENEMKGVLDYKTFMNAEVHELRKYVDEKRLFQEINDSSLTTQDIKTEAIQKLQTVGTDMSYADCMDLLSDIINEANPVPMDGILEVEISISKANRSLIKFLMSKYNCTKVFKKGSTKNVKTLKDLDNLK